MPEPPSLFARIDALADPERPAMLSPAGRLSYGQLLRRARLLAGPLAESAGPLLVYGHKEPAIVVAFLAALRCGRPYVPVDTSAPAARIARILDLASPGVVIAAQALPPPLADDLARRAIPVIALDPLAEAAERFTPGTQPPERRADRSDDPVYIMFTSGTTGDPKGVPIPYRGLAHFTNWLLQSQQFVPGGEVFLNQAPFNFDLSVMDLYGALLTGGTLWSIRREEIADPRLLFGRLQGAPLTTWVSTPSFARFCLAEPSFDPTMLPSLQRFLFCGETLPPAVARELQRRFPAAGIWNTYGPTEATVAVTAVRLTPAMLEAGQPLPVGRPARGMEVWIADPAEPLQRLPAGAWGEIVIAGPQVALGYLGHGQRGGADGPFLALPIGDAAYRTGDLGRFDACGLLYCQGRLDRQVKLHGYRLELEEIESHLRRIPGVADAAVLVVERDGRPDSLVAFVVPAQQPAPGALPDGGLALTQHIRAQLTETLPTYALPRRVSLLAQPPLTANGKLDRRALEALPR
jgi:D-alanine--poly(phosphoribitol) ligase subunit 1